MFGLSMQELVIIAIVAVLLFGKRLPEVARSVGKSYSQFRKGLSEMQGEFHRAMESDEPKRKARRPDRYDEYDDRDEATAPKFEPPPAAPRAIDSAS